MANHVISPYGSVNNIAEKAQLLREIRTRRTVKKVKKDIDT